MATKFTYIFTKQMGTIKLNDCNIFFSISEKLEIIVSYNTDINDLRQFTLDNHLTSLCRQRFVKSSSFSIHSSFEKLLISHLTLHLKF